MAVTTRQLGRDGPQVTAVAFGTMSIGGAYGQSNTREEKLAILDHAYAIGERFWDTADIYFDAEEVIGDWIKRNPEKRQDVFIATKFAISFEGTPPHQVVHNDREYIRATCEKSLKLLNLDYINLYYCHRVDGKTPIEKTVEAMVELKNEGKIRYLGLSEVSADTLRRACAVHHIAAHQIEYSPFALEAEKDVLAASRELGITTLAYSPVGRGLLTGQIKSLDDLGPTDFRRIVPKNAPEHFQKTLDLVAKFEEVGKVHGKSPSEIALAWLLAQGDDIIPLPGTRTKKYLEQNTFASSIRLSESEIKTLRQAANATELPGERYPEAMAINADTPPL